jgi:hypothetical protein
MKASSLRTRSLFKPNFDSLDPRIAPSDGGLHFDPPPMILIQDTGAIDAKIFYNVVGPGDQGGPLVNWPMDPLQVTLAPGI